MMENQFAEDVYDTLIGVLKEPYRVPGVENAFAPGGDCAREYERMTSLRRRIWDRLESEDDEDVERLLMAMDEIQHALCIKMFCLGQTIRRGDHCG